MAKKEKAPGKQQGASQKRQGQAVIRVNHHTKSSKNNGLPSPGTALTAFLKRHRMELLHCEHSRECSVAIDCCDQILILFERGR